MKRLLATSALLLLLAGCHRNDVTITNQGTKTWNLIEISAGGRNFTIKQLGSRTTETIRFRSQAEGGGEISGTLDGVHYKAEFGYFTPNLSTEEKITLADDGTIKILDRPRAGSESR